MSVDAKEPVYKDNLARYIATGACSEEAFKKRWPSAEYQALYGQLNRLNLFLPNPSGARTATPIIPESFFVPPHSSSDFPSPSEVHQLSTSWRPLGSGCYRDASKSLFVKFGPRVVVDEALALLAVNQLDPPFPAPKLYGFRFENELGYIYMSLVEGERLDKAWDGLNDSQKEKMALQLKVALQQLRTLRRPEGDDAICSVSGRRVRDRLFSQDTKGAFKVSFASVQAFHDAIYDPRTEHRSSPVDPVAHPNRKLLIDDFDVVFTHCDLHHSNILVDVDGNLLALIDWEQAGWMPSYWEYCRSWIFWFLEGQRTSQLMDLFLEDPGQPILDAYQLFLGNRVV